MKYLFIPAAPDAPATPQDRGRVTGFVLMLSHIAQQFIRVCRTQFRELHGTTPNLRRMEYRFSYNAGFFADVKKHPLQGFLYHSDTYHVFDAPEARIVESDVEGAEVRLVMEPKDFYFRGIFSYEVFDAESDRIPCSTFFRE